MKGAWLLVMIVWALAAPAEGQPARPKGPVRVAEGFAMEEVGRGLTAVTAMAVAPDGRVFVCEQGGRLRVIKGGEAARGAVADGEGGQHVGAGVDRGGG